MNGLFITRGIGQAVFVDETKVTVHKVRGNKVRIQFEGPGRVLREEIRDVEPPVKDEPTFVNDFRQNWEKKKKEEPCEVSSDGQ